jgi:hypothetical protein
VAKSRPVAKSRAGDNGAPVGPILENRGLRYLTWVRRCRSDLRGEGDDAI